MRFILDIKKEESNSLCPPLFSLWNILHNQIHMIPGAYLATAPLWNFRLFLDFHVSRVGLLLAIYEGDGYLDLRLAGGLQGYLAVLVHLCDLFI